jgi:hypothetical protein
MQVVCGNCQLTFDAPEGTTGLVCPICRNPLSAESGGDSGAGAKPASRLIDWNGGTLSDLIALLSAPAVSARVEVIPLGADTPIGEVHLVAGGVSDSIYDGQATDDALDKLLTITPARFRVEPRLPHPKTGDLGDPGPESGTLDGRPLAHLMRYCEDYVITCEIEVWRGNETARVAYRRGEISGVTVGGIDAPERLAEVMQWASGNYRLNVPPISLPTTAPKRTTAAVMPIIAPAPAPAARQSSSTKTMFGIPQSEIAAARAAAEAIMQAQGVGTPAPPDVAPPPAAVPEPVAPEPFVPEPFVPAPASAAPAMAMTPPGVAPSAVPAPTAASRGSATKTIFGVPAPQGFFAGKTGSAVAEPSAPIEAASEETGRTDRIAKTGARKVAVPAPEIVVVPVAAPATAPAKDPNRATQFGYDSVVTPAKKPQEKAQDAPDKAEKSDKTRPTRAPAAAKAPSRQAPIWTYVGVGFTFGLVLLGIYQLVGRLAH